MYQLQQFCCCTSLRIGSEIIGLVYLIGALISVAGCSVGIAGIYGPPDLNFFKDHHEPEYVRKIMGASQGIIVANKVVCFTILSLSCLQVIIDILLIVAAAKRKAKLAVPWLVLNAVFLIFNLAAFATVSIMAFLYMPTAVNIASIGAIVVGIIYLAVTGYAMLVVSSFYELFKTF